MGFSHTSRERATKKLTTQAPGVLAVRGTSPAKIMDQLLRLRTWDIMQSPQLREMVQWWARATLVGSPLNPCNSRHSFKTSMTAQHTDVPAVVVNTARWARTDLEDKRVINPPSIKQKGGSLTKHASKGWRVLEAEGSGFYLPLLELLLIAPPQVSLKIVDRATHLTPRRCITHD